MNNTDQITKIATNPQAHLKEIYQLLLSNNFSGIREWASQRKKIEEKEIGPDFSLELILAIICTETPSSALKFISTKRQIKEDDFLTYLAKRNREIGGLASGNQIWHWYAKGGHYDSLCQAIAARLFNPNVLINNEGDTVWHIFAFFNYYDALLFAIDDGMFNPETLRTKATQDKKGNIIPGKTVWELLPEDKIALLHTDKANTIFHLLAMRGHYRRLLAGITSGKFKHATLTNNVGATVWHYLALGGHYNELCLAIDAGLFDPATLVDEYGNTVWHYLAKGGHYDKVLLAAKANKFNPQTLKNNAGNTAWDEIPSSTWLSLIFSGRKDELFKAIEDGQCNPKNVKNSNGDTIWHYMAYYGYIDELLLAIEQKKFDPRTLLCKRGYTVWHDLAYGGHAAKLKLLLDTKMIDTRLYDKPKYKLIDCVPEDKWHIKSKYSINKKKLKLKGKNEGSCIVNSNSKKDQYEKEWVQKPLNDLYPLHNAVKEVFFGQLAVKIFGKSAAPKTKFNLEYPAIVSRIIRETSDNITDLHNAFANNYTNIIFSETAQLSLTKALCYGVIINDRDIADRNIVVKYKLEQHPQKICTVHDLYSIDHEYIDYRFEGAISFEDFFTQCYNNSKKLTDILIKDKSKWSHVKATFSKSSAEATDHYHKKWFDKVTDANVQTSFTEIAQKIAADDFKLCTETKQEIYADLIKPNSIYGSYFTNKIIMPLIDSLIEKLQKRVHFVIEHSTRARNKICLKPS